MNSYSMSAIISLIFLSSCSSNTAFNARRDFAIQLNQESLNSSKNTVRLKWSKDVLLALDSTDVKNVTNPKLASAIFAKGENGSYGLFVFWIQNVPTIDAVELQFDDKTDSIVIPIPELELKQNQSTAKQTIVFDCELQWESTSALWKNLELLNDSKKIKIRLISSNKPVTDWFSVDFYKENHWIINN